MEIDEITRDCYSDAGTSNGWADVAATCSWEEAKDIALANAENLDGQRIDGWTRPPALATFEPPMLERVKSALALLYEISDTQNVERRKILTDAGISVDEIADAYDLIRTLDDCLESLAADFRNAADWLRECGEKRDALESAIDSQPDDPAELAGDLARGGYTLAQAHSMLWRNGYITQGESLGEGLVRVLDAIAEGKAVG